MAGPSSSTPPPLDANDSYAKHLENWRNCELPEWQKEFEAWDGKERIPPPPTVPTVSEKGRTNDKELKARRKAAYDAVVLERKPAHNAWTKRNGKRKAAGQAVLDAQRDWRAERRERDAAATQAATLQRLRAEAAPHQALEAEVEALRGSPELAALPEPTAAELQLAEAYTSTSEPRKISARALLEVRARHAAAAATVERIIQNLEAQAAHAALEPGLRKMKEQERRVMWFEALRHRAGAPELTVQQMFDSAMEQTL